MSALDKPFAAVAKARGHAYAITPRAMRRTYHDLSRAAKVADTRAISGHATPKMQRHYSRYPATRCARVSRGSSTSRLVANARPPKLSTLDRSA
jgi:hypothetical protein